LKVILQVPYSDRREAKRRGAHWDPSTKKWYVLSRPEFLACRHWWPVWTDEAKAELYSWLKDLSLTKQYGEAVASTPNPVRRTSSREPDRVVRRIKSPKNQKRQKRHQKYHPHLKVGSAKIAALQRRFPASAFGDSSTEIHSITVKLPL